MNREARVEEPITLTPDVISSVFREEVRDLHVRQEETPVQRGLRLAAVRNEPALGQLQSGLGATESVKPTPTEQSPSPARVSVVLGRLLSSPNPSGKGVAKITSPEVASRDLEPEQFGPLASVQQWMAVGKVSEGEIQQLPKDIRRKTLRILRDRGVEITKDTSSRTDKITLQGSAPLQTDIEELPVPAESVTGAARTERKVTAGRLLGWIVLGRGLTVRKTVAATAGVAVLAVGAHYADAVTFNVTKDFCDANSAICLPIKGAINFVGGTFDFIGSVLPGGREK